MSARKIGLIVAITVTSIFVVVVAIVILNLGNLNILYALIAAPFLFGCMYTMAYALRKGYIAFLRPSKVKDAYDNPIDNYMTSEYDKVKGSYVLSVACFIPMLIFFILFSWIFYLCRR